MDEISVTLTRDEWEEVVYCLTADNDYDDIFNKIEDQIDGD